MRMAQHARWLPGGGVWLRSGGEAGLRNDRTAYDRHVFSVVLADVPDRKQDLVRGRYELPTPASGSAAVKLLTCWAKRCSEY